MSELTQTQARGGAGKPLLWLAILLTLALLAFVTAAAVRSNPLYSDRAANGVSKYRFIEECKELAADADKLTVSASGQTLPLKTVIEQSSPPAAGESIQTSLSAGGPTLVQAVQNLPGGGWGLTAPVTIAIAGKGSTRTLGQLPMQCAHDKAQGQTVASLQLAGQ